MELFKSVVNVIVFDILGEIGKMLIAGLSAIALSVIGYSLILFGSGLLSVGNAMKLWEDPKMPERFRSIIATVTGDLFGGAWGMIQAGANMLLLMEMGVMLIFLGKGLSGVAIGVADILKATDNYNISDPSAGNYVPTIIKNVISSIGLAFGEIGKNGFVGKDGSIYDEDDVKKGVESVQGIGSILADIAEGLKG